MFQAEQNEKKIEKKNFNHYKNNCLKNGRLKANMLNFCLVVDKKKTVLEMTTIFSDPVNKFIYYLIE